MQAVNPNLQTLINSDARWPISRVKAYATTKSVPSKGANVSYYGVDPDTTMTGTWWTGLAATAPAGSRDEGTFLTGSNIVEPSSVIGFEWGIGGVPAPVTGRNDLWAARWYGHFFARYSGVYRFYVDLPPFARVRIKVGSTYYGTTSDGGTKFTNPDGDLSERWTGSSIEKTRQELYFDTTSLTAGNWYDISIEYHVPQQGAPQNVSAYLVVKYREPNTTTSLDLWGDSGGDIVTDYQSDYQDDDGNDIKKPLSAGVINTTAAFLTAETIPGVNGFRGTRRNGQVGEYSFTMPLPATTNVADDPLTNGAGTINADSVAGFADSGALALESDQASIYIVTYTGRNVGNNQFTGCSGVTGSTVDTLISQFMGEGAGKYITGYDSLSGKFGPISSFGLIQIEGGLYDGSNTDYYTNRVWGNIFPGPSIDRDNKLITFTVRDFTWMLIDQYDRNYPDQASYSMADYYDPHTFNTPDGITRPPCYDRWRVDRALRDIIIKGNIDPILTYQRRRLQVSGTPLFATDYGEYLLRSDLTLDSNKFYGHPLSLARTGADDEYIWTFGYGTLLHENLSEIIKNFSYMFGFTGDGFAKCEPFGIPDNEFIHTDAEVSLVNATASWQDQSSTGALESFKGKYTDPDGTPTGTMKVQMSSQYFNDLDIIVGRHSGASQVIKIKIGASYLTELIIDGVEVSGSGGGGNEFTITRAAGDWFLYDGVDASIVWNPAIIRIPSVLSFDTRTVDLEVISGLVRFNAFFLYNRSARTTVRSLDDDKMGTLKMTQDIVNQRNEISVVGAARGKAETSDGETVNPNNPIFVHTVSRAIDLRSLYETDYEHYVGHVRSTELFDSRILNQERADSVAANSLIKYRGKEIEGSTRLLFDPSIEPADSISITDHHSHLLNSSQAWLNEIEEIYSIDANGATSYITSLRDLSPREPLTSMRFKPEPDISDWNNEPIVNLELRYRGYRISGNDASLSGRVITISSSPGWPTNHWAGYYIADDIIGVTSPRIHEIESNTANTITLVDVPDRWFDNSWAITFDPLDAEDGEPLEIKYDQIVAAKVSVQITGIDGRLIANLNDETKDLFVNWGVDKSIFWNGEIQFGAREGRKGFLVSRDTLFEYNNKVPFVIKFTVTRLTSTTQWVLLSYSANEDGTQISSPQLNGSATLNNPFGGCKIVTQVLDTGYSIGWYASGNKSGSDNRILDAGRMIDFTDKGSGVYRLFIDGRGSGEYNSTPFIDGDYIGKYVMSGKSGAVTAITDSGAGAPAGEGGGVNAWIEITISTDLGTAGELLKTMGFEGTFSIWRDGDHSDVSDDAEYPWLSIVDNQHQPISFKSADNNGLGLKLRFTQPEFYVEGLNNLMFRDGLADRPSLVQPDFEALFFYADYKTICENELTVHYEGSSYTIPANSDVKLAQFGTRVSPLVAQSHASVGLGNTYSSSVLENNQRTLGGAIQIFWSKYFPTRLWMSAGANTDANNPEQGTFVIFEFRRASPAHSSLSTTLSLGNRIRCPVNVPKAKSFVMAPFLEMHQLTGKIIGTVLVSASGLIVHSTLAGQLKLLQGIGGGDVANYEFKLPEADGFISATDLLVTVSPELLVAENDGEPIIFWRNQLIWQPQISLWHILVKPVILDRVGRGPTNLTDPFPGTEDPDLITSAQFTRTDYNSISAFWDPDDGATASLLNALGSNWMSMLNNANSLNLPVAVPLNIWTK